MIDGRRYLYFAGTAYLGLQGHPEVIRAACEATQRYGIGSATNRAWFGTTPPLLEVERLAAELFAAEDAFYYVSGYVGHHILLAGLAGAVRGHSFSTSWRTTAPARLVGSPAFRSTSSTIATRPALADCLRAKLPSGGRPLVVSDGVFPVLGTIAPLADYYEILALLPRLGAIDRRRSRPGRSWPERPGHLRAYGADPAGCEWGSATAFGRVALHRCSYAAR